MVLLKLAYKNLVRAGLRTWLNALALSFGLVAIIGLQGLYIGMGEQAARVAKDAEYGGGQYWHKLYDPYDPLTLQDAHGKIPQNISKLISEGKATPILIVQATAYPQGRTVPVLLKGIIPEQKILKFPTGVLKTEDVDGIPALIGERMAAELGVKEGDYLTVRWRDVNGTFDATDVKIVKIMSTTDQNIDNGQIWVPLKVLQRLTGMEEEATIIVVSPDLKNPPPAPGFEFKNLKFLLKTIEALVKVKTQGTFVIYIILLSIALISIFDSQVFSIFKRKKEIGTLMALGFTRLQVIILFTLEGALHAFFAVILSALYGAPLLIYAAKVGYALPKSATESFAIALGERLYPRYGAGLIIGTAILVFIVTTIVSYLPVRKIAKMKPTEALRGGIQ